MRKLAILMAALVMALSPVAALAKSDQTPPGQTEKSDPPGQAKKAETDTPLGQAKKAESDTPPGQAKKNDSATPPGQAKQGDSATPAGQAKKNDDKPSPPGQTKADDDKPPPPGQTKTEDKPTPPGQTNKADPAIGPKRAAPVNELDEVQRAVESREALPLAKIVAIAQGKAQGHVINARLMRVDGVLLYQLTLLGDDGRNWREYYYARSGNPVVLP